MVYNVGFMAKTNATEFYGQFAYKQNDTVPNTQDCESYCDQIMMSWYKDLKTGKLGCFYGEKIKLFEEMQENQMFSMDGTSAEKTPFAEQAKELKYEDLEFLVAKINSQTYILLHTIQQRRHMEG